VFALPLAAFALGTLAGAGDGAPGVLAYIQRVEQISERPLVTVGELRRVVTLAHFEAVLLPFLLVFEQPHCEFIVPVDHDLTARIREYELSVVRMAPGPGRRCQHLL